MAWTKGDKHGLHPVSTVHAHSNTRTNVNKAFDRTEDKRIWIKNSTDYNVVLQPLCINTDLAAWIRKRYTSGKWYLTIWGLKQTIFCSICCGKFIFVDYILQENVTKSWGRAKIERPIEEEVQGERRGEM